MFNAKFTLRISFVLSAIMFIAFVSAAYTSQGAVYAQGPKRNSPVIIGYSQPADLVLGQSSFTTTGGGFSSAQLAIPSAVALDPTTGKIFVSDYGNSRVLRYPAGSASGASAEAVLGQPSFAIAVLTTTRSSMKGPVGISVDSSGRLWVAEQNNNRVLRFDSASSKSSGADADAVLGQAYFTTSVSALTQNSMSSPEGIFADLGGRVWVADYGNSRVLRFNNAASKSNGANADGVLGQADFTSTLILGGPAYMNGPFGMYVDASGTLWVAVYGQNRVLRFDNAAAKANGADADGVLGQIDFNGILTATTQSGMYNPLGVTGDISGTLYVADGNNNRILVFGNAATLANGVNASTVLGQPIFSSSTPNNGGVSARSLYYPHGLFVDSSNHLWVADYQNNRVLRYSSQRQIYLPLIMR